MRTYKNGIYGSKEHTELKTALLDAERNGQSVTFYTRSRRMIDRFTCIDTPQKPIKLGRFTVHGGLVYYKANQFEWRTISQDDILEIAIDEVKEA